MQGLDVGSAIKETCNVSSVLIILVFDLKATTEESTVYVNLVLLKRVYL